MSTSSDMTMMIFRTKTASGELVWIYLALLFWPKKVPFVWYPQSVYWPTTKARLSVHYALNLYEIPQYIMSKCCFSTTMFFLCFAFEPQNEIIRRLCFSNLITLVAKPRYFMECLRDQRLLGAVLVYSHLKLILWSTSTKCHPLC